MCNDAALHVWDEEHPDHDMRKQRQRNECVDIFKAAYGSLQLRPTQGHVVVECFAPRHFFYVSAPTGKVEHGTTGTFCRFTTKKTKFIVKRAPIVAHVVGPLLKAERGPDKYLVKLAGVRQNFRVAGSNGLDSNGRATLEVNRSPTGQTVIYCTGQTFLEHTMEPRTMTNRHFKARHMFGDIRWWTAAEKIFPHFHTEFCAELTEMFFMSKWRVQVTKLGS